MYFFAFFIGNLILNAVFKDDLNIGTAFSVALGFSMGLAFIGYFVEKKMNKKIENKYDRRSELLVVAF
jgi:hypothetical protein